MKNDFLNNFKHLDKSKKEKFVSQIFSNVADNYDFMNDVMSFGLHRSWKRKMISLMKINPSSVVLDLASGSGDLASLVKKKSNCNCIIYDANTDMLKKAKKKIEDGIFIAGKAENLPFKNNIFDYVIVAFGLRNFSDMNKALVEIRRVLKKGGVLLSLEFSDINSNILKKLFYFYGKFIPKYAGLLLNKKLAYEYLIESIKQFPDQIELSRKLKKNKFNNINVIDILDGLAAIHTSEK